ncbi:transglutaminaseTgpA domain-containing protein [Herbiconiux sp. YIM B11900]|uniref:transglutaminaseTgpA domain-containing protein n=1 Tax=Herbiconiux sp. YIM B11900 TaxID=3404131 RepID=UPI003F867336
MSARRIAVSAVFMAALLFTAAGAWWPVYGSASFLLMAGVTVAVGTIVGGAGARWSWPAPVLAGALLAAWLLLGVPLAVPAKAFAGVLPTTGGLADLVVTTATGWRQLLTIELPVGSFQALLVPAFVLLLVSSVLGTTVATRTRRPALAALFPVAVLVSGIAFGGGTAFAPIVIGGVFTVLLVAWLAICARFAPGGGSASGAERASGAGRAAAAAASRSAARVSARGAGPGRVRTVVAASVVTALAVLASVGVATAVPPGERTVLRDAVEQPFDSSRSASPLAGFRAYVKSPLADSVLLTVSGLATGSRIAVARMDDYDGVVFGVGGGTTAQSLFTRVPGALSSARASGGGSTDTDTDTVSARVTVGRYDGVWVPTTGDPLAIDFGGPDAATLQDSLYYSAGLQTAATTAGLTEGDAYELRAVPDAVPTDVAALTPGEVSAGDGRGADPSPVTSGDSAGVLPDALSTRLAEWAPDSLSPGARLQGLLSGLRSGYRSSGLEGEVFSRSGHGTDRLQELLTATPMVGDAEQYAAAAALLARAAGFPSRVALGFVVPATAEGVADPSVVPAPTGPGAEADPGAVAVRGQDATAWLEVYTAEDGWVALDPVPELRPIPESALNDTRTAVQPPEVVPPPSGDLDDPAEAVPLQQDDDVPPASDELLATALRIAGIVGLVLAGLAVLLSPFLTVIAMKARRRRHRRSRGPARSRAAGSWAELLDAARDAALPLPANATRREAGRLLDAAGRSQEAGHPDAAGRAGGAGHPEAAGSVALAARVDGALYSPVEPDEAELRALWAASDQRRRELRAGQDRLARLRSRVSTRSLRPYHGRDRKRRS